MLSALKGKRIKKKREREDQQTLSDSPPPYNETPPSNGEGLHEPPNVETAAAAAVAAVEGHVYPRPYVAPRIVFHCQLAHGSPTGIVSTFSSVRELYEKIAACFDINPSEILFCTLNSHKVDMTKLMGGQLALDDFIFAHIKGRPKEVDIEKTDVALGLTITDNGAGYAFIKGIKADSVVERTEFITVGDHIEKIGDKSVIGYRHHEVAKLFREIPQGATFKLRVVEPLKSGFSEIGAHKSSRKNGGGLGTGKETLRLRSKGPATVETCDEMVNVAISKINDMLESFLGISDMELAQTIWEIGQEKNNPSDFTVALDGSDLSDFGFTESFIFDLWGAISDAKQGRLQNLQDFHEQF